MKGTKKIKDPIYGYIDIPVEYMDTIIDTPNFQRLRRIIQTSYTPLYSSAVHNRFVHSLGVYYLGDIAAKVLENEIQADESMIKYIDVAHIAGIFRLACLLHDVGHAPFSHTGEAFYLSENKKYDEIHELLVAAVGSEQLKRDIPLIDAAAPHEIMSVILALKVYGKIICKTEDKEFFARCITGYRYEANCPANCLKNCFINMLNSKVIDVDRLDYLLRDAYLSGFNTISIDYHRLLENLTIIDASGKGKYELAYYKNAVSVIENVVYAHDAERKWIQTHPVVLYESYIIQRIVANLNHKMNTENRRLFSLDTLTEEGQVFDGEVSIRLLCDDDIIYLMKNVYPDEIGKEFFDRRERRHPLWKSEAEYKAFVGNRTGSGGEFYQVFSDAMESTADYLTGCSGVPVINEDAIEDIGRSLKALEDMQLDEDSKTAQQIQKKRILAVMKALKQFAEQQNGGTCDFVLLSANQFKSSFNKPDFANTNIVFKTSDGNIIKKFSDVTSILKSDEGISQRFYYLFYKRESGKIGQDKICDLIRSLMYQVNS